MLEIDKELKKEALRFISNLKLQTHETIYTQTDYVGNAGTAYVRVYVMRDNKPLNITWHVGHATSLSLRNRNGRHVIHTGGGGYSRGQHVVEFLSMLEGGQTSLLKQEEL